MPTTQTTPTKLLTGKPEIPLPGQLLDQSRLVIASIIYTDEDPNEVTWTLLVLRPQPPYFQVVLITVLTGQGVWRIDDENEPILNIVPAVEQYKEWGGDY